MYQNAIFIIPETMDTANLKRELLLPSDVVDAIYEFRAASDDPANDNVVAIWAPDRITLNFAISNLDMLKTKFYLIDSKAIDYSEVTKLVTSNLPVIEISVMEEELLSNKDRRNLRKQKSNANDEEVINEPLVNDEEE